MNLQTVRLKKNEDRRILAGHAWIYSNEIDTKITPMRNFAPGEVVRIENATGKRLGIGYINPQVLLSVRLLTHDSTETIDKDFFVRRIKRALSARETYYDLPFYRLIFGEGDFLPGLIVDRYGDVLILQINTAGMESLKGLIIAALQDILHPQTIFLRNDTSSRKLEGLENCMTTVVGDLPQIVNLQENGVTFAVDICHGQKTGWFYDQRPNRSLLIQHVKGKRVLDIFSYIGAWGVQAAVFGASEVICIDSSDKAMQELHNNALSNGVANKIHCMIDDAFSALKQLIHAKELFDVIILDPPALIKKRKDLDEGSRAYLRLQKLALFLLCEGGLLFTASCSMLLSRDMLLNNLRQAGLDCKKELQILAQLHQGMDHPINPAIAETEYLKGFMVRVNNAAI
jgi:23S rRNA (cytosine1962-C5)-methyltransferase